MRKSQTYLAAVLHPRLPMYSGKMEGEHSDVSSLAAIYVDPSICDVSCGLKICKDLSRSIEMARAGMYLRDQRMVGRQREILVEMRGKDYLAELTEAILKSFEELFAGAPAQSAQRHSTRESAEAFSPVNRSIYIPLSLVCAPRDRAENSPSEGTPTLSVRQKSGR